MEIYAKIDRLSGYCDQIDFEICGARADTASVDGVRYSTPLCWPLAFGYSSKIRVFLCKTQSQGGHDWVHKCDLQPADNEKPNHVAFNETVIQLDKYRYWLYTVVDPETNIIRHIWVYSTTSIALTERFLHELTEKYDLDDGMFFVDGAVQIRLME